MCVRGVTQVKRATHMQLGVLYEAERLYALVEQEVSAVRAGRAD